MPSLVCAHNHKGFTLIEMVVVITLLCIVSVMSVQLIMPIFNGYVDARIVDRLYNEAKFAVERIDRELRMAIPNTIRIDNPQPSDWVQFAPFINSGYYDEHQTNKKVFETTDTLANSLANGDWISVYNTNPSHFYNGSKRYQIQSVDTGANEVTVDKNLVPHSPNRRFYLLDTSLCPVTFYHSGTRLFRSFGYAIASATYGTSNGDVLATHVKNATFTYEKGNLYRNAYIDIELTMTDGDISLDYSHQVHVRNMP